jgi:RimJ/RimL family protein N-acetyltransferase
VITTEALLAMAGRAGDRRVEVLIRGEDAAGQRAAMAAGFQREGIRRGALDGADAVPFARLPGDPPGPAPRLLPDLPGGELTDGVVTLRPLGPADIDFYAELHTDRDVIDTSVPPEPKSAEEVRLRCTWAESYWLAGTRADMVVFDTATGAPTGIIGLFYQEPPTGQAMVGYSQLAAWRGRGYMTRAVQLLSLWVYAETGVARLIAGTNPANKGSQRVLEKAGFHQEAYLRSRLPGPANTRTDDVQYVLLPEDVLNAISPCAPG